ncbi:MAG: hypothetical protein ACRC3H_00075 [Lachnospiraceae bacterium]
MEPKIGIIGYYNVRFYLILRSEEDHAKFNYLAIRIDSGEAMRMQSIYDWCDNQGIPLFQLWENSVGDLACHISENIDTIPIPEVSR